MTQLRLEELSCSFERERPAVDRLSLALEKGEFFCLVGPSGCGKSTLLRLIGGYLPPSAGKIWMAGREVTHETPEHRNAGMVFQNYALFPHLTALDNVAFGLRVRGVGKNERHARANEMLDWVGLTPAERLRHPAQLSGGQQQRVALARALAPKPDLLMLDEPFANLDRLLRERLRDEMKQIQRRSDTTTILVTHDREEAFALADRLAIMAHGRILQTGTPQEVFEKPANAFVADFLGHRNLLRVSEMAPEILAAAGLSGKPGDFLLLRPELLQLNDRAGLPAVVAQKRFAGTYETLILHTASGSQIELQRNHSSEKPSVGEKVFLQIPPAAASFLSSDESPA